MNMIYLFKRSAKSLPHEGPSKAKNPFIRDKSIIHGRTMTYHVRKNGIIDIRDLFPCRPKFIK